MKLSHQIISLIILINIAACNEPGNNNIQNHVAEGFEFPVPKGWQSENIKFPIEFAPSIIYTGTESLRFMPGFESAISQEYWSYSFLWWLDGKPAITDTSLMIDLRNYYQGLVQSNAKQKNIPAAKLGPPLVEIHKVETSQPVDEVFAGKIIFTDYMAVAQNKISLNCMITKKICGNHTAVLYKLSPQPLEQPVWKQLDSLGNQFKCLTTN